MIKDKIICFSGLFDKMTDIILHTSWAIGYSKTEYKLVLT